MPVETEERDLKNLQDGADPFPFPLNQETFCRYETIEKTIGQARVLIVDNLLRNEGDLSDIAREEWGKDVSTHLKRERQIAELALQNIVSNVKRLVKQPHTRLAHISSLADAVDEFKPDAAVLSGTLRDFDYYNPEILSGFSDFIHEPSFPLLGIFDGH